MTDSAVAVSDANPRQVRPDALARARSSARRWLVVGLLGAIAFFGVAGTWAAVTRISGAVVAPGQVVVESSPKKVQHREGGIVAEILARNGDSVMSGDILLRLDSTVARANLTTVVKRLAELRARHARLSAEAVDAVEMSLPPEIAGSADPHLSAAVSGERRLFEARRAARQNKREQLEARIPQLEDEARAYEAEGSAAERELAFAQFELAGLEQLAKQSLIKLTDITQSRRLSANLTGRVAASKARAANAKGGIGELRLAVADVAETNQSEALKELRATEAEIAEMTEKQIALADALERTAIRSPRDGVVHALEVHTIGGVVEAGATILTVVPGNDALVVEARVAPDDVDQVRAGQAATVRFPAFNQRTTPERRGSVVHVAADVTSPSNHDPYFIVRVALDPTEAPAGLALTSGMSAQVFLSTSERSPLSFLIKPLSDQFQRALRE